MAVDRQLFPKISQGKRTIILFLVLLGPAAGAPLAADKPDPRRQAGRALAVVDSLLAAGKLEEGVRIAGEARSRFAHDPRLAAPLENREALGLMSLGRHAEALPLLESAVRRQPTSGPAHRNLGACLLGLGRRGRALTEYREFVVLEPRNWKAHLEYGQVLRDFHMLADAQRELRLAPELCGVCPEVDPVLAATLLDSGQAPAALAPLRRLMAGPDAPRYRVHFLKALLESGEDKELVGCLVTSPEPLDGQAVRLLIEAEGRLQQARWSRALLDLAGGAANGTQKGLDLAPGWDDDPLLWARISLNLQQAGDNGAALAAVDRGLVLDPDSVLLLNNRVVLLQNLGRDDEAARVWRRAVELDPSLERK